MYNKKADRDKSPMQVKRRSTQVGRRGAPAKGVGRVTGARVRISPSPPERLHKIDAATENPDFIGVFTVFMVKKVKGRMTDENCSFYRF